MSRIGSAIAVDSGLCDKIRAILTGYLGRMAGHSKWANIKHRKERQDAGLKQQYENRFELD